MSGKPGRKFTISSRSDSLSVNLPSGPISNCSCGAPVAPYVVVPNGAAEAADRAPRGTPGTCAGQPRATAGTGGQDLVLWHIREDHKKDLAHVPCLVSTWGTVLVCPRAARSAGAPEALAAPALTYLPGGEHPTAGAGREGVSDRERDIMNGLSRGFTNTEIAQALFISEKTVKNHINRLFAKLGARHRAEAMAIWLGLARTEQPDERAGVAVAAGDGRCDHANRPAVPWEADRDRCKVSA